MKKILAVLVVLLLVLALFVACGKESTTEPLPAETIRISSVQDLVNLKNYLGVKYKNYVFELTADLDLSDIEAWTPIGDDLNNAFMATLHGNHHTISHLQIKGVAEDHTPSFVVKDKGSEFVTSFASCGLFGYTSSATVTELTLADIDFDYYVDYNGFSYGAGLVGFNYGASTFTDINVGGSIKVNNVFKKYLSYNLDAEGSTADLVDECTTTLFLGGVVGGSTGDSTFTDVHSTVNFDNYLYCSYYRTRENAESYIVDNPDVPFVEGYQCDGYDHYQTQHAYYKVEKVIAGGVVGQIKGGTYSDMDYTGDMRFNARDVYAGGIFGATYNATMSDLSVVDATCTSYVSNKNLLGGLVADLDDCSLLSSSTVDGLTINANRHGDAQKITVGGVFGYAVSLASTSDVSAENVTVTVPIKEATVGGIGGIARDAKISDSIATDTTITFRSKEYTKVGTALGEAEGNSVINNVHATATILVSGTGAIRHAVDETIGTKAAFGYYNEDGKPAVRFYKKGSNSTYVTVDATISGTTLTVNIYNEELDLLTTSTYELDAADSTVENPAKEYRAVFFEEGVGFKNNVTVAGRDFTKYEYRSGEVTETNVDNVLPE